jgi:hypothetical protein
MRRRTLAMILGTFLAPAAAAAGLVAPGQTAAVRSSDLTAPDGALVATTSAGFAVDYVAAGVGPAFPAALAGTLHSSVYRGGDGRLTFVYDVDLVPATGVGGAAEGSDLRVGSFAGVATDVTGALDFEDLVLGSRSADGASVGLRSDTPGLGGPPTLVVRTDATRYDAGGRASYYAADELATPDGPAATFFGTAAIAGVYRPAAGGGGVSPGPTPHPVPLPPAAYSGLGVLLAMGLIAAFRKYLPRFA